MKRRASKWDRKEQPKESRDGPTPERQAKPVEAYQDPVTILVDRGKLTPGQESACEEYRRLWREVIGMRTHARGTLDDTQGRALKPESRYAEADMERWKSAAVILGPRYGIFRDVTIYWRYPFYEMADFIEAARILAKAWRMEMRRAS